MQQHKTGDVPSSFVASTSVRVAHGIFNVAFLFKTEKVASG